MHFLRRQSDAAANDASLINNQFISCTEADDFGTNFD
jgi:hypothetical protein